MQATAVEVTATPKVFRNSRIGVALIFFSAWVGFATAALLAAIAIVELFSLVRFSMEKLYGVAAMMVSAFLSLGAAMQLQSWARSMTGNAAHLDADGVRFELGGAWGSEGDPGCFRWSEIASVTRRRAGNNLRLFSVTTTDGRKAVFSPLSFFRAGHIAREIASRAGVPISSV